MDAANILNELEYTKFPHGFDLFPNLFANKLYEANQFDKWFRMMCRLAIEFDLGVLIWAEGKDLKGQKEEQKLFRRIVISTVGSIVESNFKDISSIKKIIEHVYSKLFDNETIDVVARFEECSSEFSKPAHHPSFEDLERFEKGWNVFRNLEEIYHRQRDVLRETEFSYLINDKGNVDFRRLIKYYRKHHPILFNDSIKALHKDSIKYIEMQSKEELLTAKSNHKLLNAKSKVIKNFLIISEFDLDDIVRMLDSLRLFMYERGKKTLNEQYVLVANLRRQLLIIRHIMDKIPIDKQYSVLKYMNDRQVNTSVELKFVKLRANINYVVFRSIMRKVIINNLLLGLLYKSPLLINFYFENSTLLTNYNEQFRILMNSRDFLPQTQQIALDYIIEEEVYTPNPREFIFELNNEEEIMVRDYIDYSLSLELTDPDLTEKLVEKMPKLSCDEIPLPSYDPVENCWDYYL